MVATTMQNSSANQLTRVVESLLPPDHRVATGSSFYWSPQTKTIHVDADRLSTPHGQLALLHEASHALLGHASYSSDVSLLKLEVAAWDKARELAALLGVEADSDHIEDCLDTYRDWLYARSSCPNCHISGLQSTKDAYECVNCAKSWRVSGSRFCRVYRMEHRHKKTPPQPTETVFS